MSKYVLLDYDGFICKAFYAALSKSELDEAHNILHRLEKTAISKACNYFDTEKVIVRKFVSGHTWKKDAYNTYKESREKNSFLGLFRKEVLDYDKEIIKFPNLEADDCINIIQEYIDCYDNDYYVTFSDDKDLHNTATTYCKINLNEEIVSRPWDYTQLFCQMLAGDKEDDVEGIPKVGMKTALKLLGDNRNIQHVIEIYRDKKIPLEKCRKEIALILPLSYYYNNNGISAEYFANRLLTDKTIKNEDISWLIQDVIDGQKEFLNNITASKYGVNTNE